MNANTSEASSVNDNASAPTADHCPLCWRQTADYLWSVPYQDIWAALGMQWEADFPPRLRLPYDEVGKATLYVCRACGLQFFSPVMPGDAAFYSVLASSPAVHTEDRWEFDRVVERLGSTDRVIDFGAGRGTFVRRAAAVAQFTLGCDHSPSGDSGDVIEGSFADVAAEHSAEFTVATAFHVLEHVRSVRDIVDSALVALRPGGRLFLSTPDRDRTLRDSFEVLDCPPHHISRWSGEQFASLADIYGLRLISTSREAFIRRSGLRKVLPYPLLCAAGLLYHRIRGRTVQPPHGRKVGTREDRWPMGLAIMAEYQVP